MHRFIYLFLITKSYRKTFKEIEIVKQNKKKMAKSITLLEFSENRM